MGSSLFSSKAEAQFIAEKAVLVEGSIGHAGRQSTERRRCITDKKWVSNGAKKSINLVNYKCGELYLKGSGSGLVGPPTIWEVPRMWRIQLGSKEVSGFKCNESSIYSHISTK